MNNSLSLSLSKKEVPIMFCCELRKKALLEMPNAQVSSEGIKEYYLTYIAPLFLLKNNVCSSCKIFCEESQSLIQRTEEAFKEQEVEAEKIIKAIDIEIVKKICQVENFSKENVFWFGCNNKWKAQDWIVEKCLPLDKDILWIADKSLKENAVIRKESEEEKLIDDLNLLNNFLLVFLPSKDIQVGFNFKKGGSPDVSDYQINFSRAYAVILKENHVKCLRASQLLRKCFYCSKSEKEVNIARGKEYETLTNYAELKENEMVCINCFQVIREEKAKGGNAIEITKRIVERVGGKLNHEFHCDDCKKIMKIIDELRESKKKFSTFNKEELKKLGKIAYDKIISYKQKKGFLCENGEKYLGEIKELLEGGKNE